MFVTRDAAPRPLLGLLCRFQRGAGSSPAVNLSSGSWWPWRGCPAARHPATVPESRHDPINLPARYDLFWDIPGHTDRHQRTQQGEWKPQLGP